MRCINNFNKARIELESRFDGLGHAHTTLIKSLITRADPETGLVEGLNYRDLADILTVDHAPGRKGCGTPQKQTIRSYLRTIEDNCGDDFRLISFGQKIKFHFLQMPKIYAYFFGQNESYTDAEGESKSSNTLAPYETFNTVDVIPEPEKSINFPGEVEFENTAKKVLLINKTNKLTNDGGFQFFSNKQPIQPDFYPDADTIAEATSRGFERVTDAGEIAAFIEHNQSRNTQWANFNPVYLQWLSRGAEYKKRQQQLTEQRSKQNGYRNARNYQSRKTPLELVIEQNPDAVSPSGKPCGQSFYSDTFSDHAEHGVVVDGVNELIRRALYEQERREAERLMA